MVIFRHFNLVIDFCISARNSINNHFFTRCPLTKSFSMLFNNTRNNPQTRMFCYTYSSVLPFVVYYPLLILSTNSSGVSISILEKPNHFLPKSFMDAPM